jgi:ribosomal protein L7/L12
MKAGLSKDERPSVTSRARKLLEAGENYDVVLAFLRAEGVTKLDSIKLFCEVAGLSLLDAKRLVHNSDVWTDSFQRDENFHASLLKAVAGLDRGLDSDTPESAHSGNRPVKARN